MRFPATLAAAAIALSGCVTDGPDGSDPAFAGTWEDTVVQATPFENKVFHSYTFGPGNAFAFRSTDFDKDSAGDWVENGTYATTGSANTYAPVPGGDSYLLLDYTFTVGASTFDYGEVVKFEVAAGKLGLTKAHALIGSSSTLQGTWRSVLDSTKIDYRINKLLYSFTTTPAGKFISHYPDDTLDLAISSSSFTVQDSLYLGPVTVAYHLAKGKLFLDRTDTQLTLRKKGG